MHDQKILHRQYLPESLSAPQNPDESTLIATRITMRIKWNRQLQVDRERGRYMVAYQKQVCFGKCSFPESQPIAVPELIAEGVTNLAPGDELQVKLTASRPNIDFELLSGPKDLTLKDDDLNWKVKFQDIGTHDIVIGLRDGGRIVEQQLSVTVAQSKMTFPFRPEKAMPDEKGRNLLIWSPREPEADSNASAFFTRCAVIDASTGAVIADKIMEAEFAALHFTTDRLYAISLHGDFKAAIECFDSQTLEPTSKFPITLATTVPERVSISLYDSDTVVVCPFNGNPAFYSLSTHEQLSSDDKAGDTVLTTTQSGWQKNGMWWTPGAARPSILLQTGDFISHVPGISGTTFRTTPAIREQCSVLNVRTPNSAFSNYRSESVNTGTLPVIFDLEINSDNRIHWIDLVIKDRTTRQILHRLAVNTVQPESFHGKRLPLRTLSPSAGIRSVEDLLQSKECVFAHLAVNGGFATVTFNGSTYLKKIEEADLQVKQQPLRFGPEQGALVAENDLVKLKYTCEKTDMPNQPWPLVIEILGSHLVSDPDAPDFEPRAREKVFKVHNGTLTQNRPIEVEVGLTDYLKDQMRFIADGLVQASSDTVSVEILFEAYQARSRDQFREATGRDPVGIPVAIPVRVTMTGLREEKVTLQHFLLVEIPADRLLRPVQVAMTNRWKGSAVALETENKVATELGLSLEAYRDMKQFGGRIRALHRRGSKPALEFSQQIAAATSAHHKRWEERQKKLEKNLGPQKRQWTDVDGNKITGILLREFAGTITIETLDSPALTFDIADLSVEDQNYLTQWNQMKKTSEAHRLNCRIEWEMLGKAFESFKLQSNVYPPAALLDDEGNRLLSWRVLLLPYLDAPELYQLFDLNEPWDGPHNIALIQYMPAVYALGHSTTSHSQMLALTGPDTVFSPHRLRQRREILKPATVIVPVIASAAVQWTKPEDIPLVELEQRLKDLLQTASDISTLRSDGSIAPAAKDRSLADWMDAARVDLTPSQD